MTPNLSGGLVNGAAAQGTGHDGRSGPDMTAGMESVTNPRDSPFKTCDPCVEKQRQNRFGDSLVLSSKFGGGTYCDSVGHGSVRRF